MTDPFPDRRYAISFVLPAFNEEANIGLALENVLRVAGRYCSEFEVIVVDDGSTDRTGSLVAAVAARVPQVRAVHHSTNKGYGEAVRSGLEAARLDLIFLTDADNQFDLDELALLLPWVDSADVVAGYRRNRQDKAMRRLNAWAWNRLVRALFSVPVRDIDCAFKLFRRSALADLDLESVGAMVSTELMVKLGHTGRTVVEVGVTHLPRTAGVARGAKLRVIARALIELAGMHRRLSQATPTAPDLRR